MKPKYELGYGYSGEVYARDTSKIGGGRRLLPAWKRFIRIVTSLLIVAWSLCMAFLSWADGIGVSVCILLFAGFVGFIMWAGPLDEEFFVGDDDEIPNRTLCYSYDINFYGQPLAMAGIVAHKVLEAALKSEIYSAKAVEIIEAGIIAMNDIAGRRRRQEVSIAISPHLYKLEKQMSEDQDAKTATAKEHIEMLLGKDPV